MTPYYSRNGVTIYCGDNAEIMQSWDAGSIDLTVTSPPYDNLRTYNGYTFDFPAVAGQLWRVTAKGGVVVWVVADATVNGSETGTSFRQALHFMELGFNCETMIYEVAGTGAKGSNDYYWQAFEYMFVFSKDGPKSVNRIADIKSIYAGTKHGTGPKYEKLKSRMSIDRIVPNQSIRPNVWRYHPSNGNDQTDHPAPFPEALARDHIISWSNPGDTILDPFMGSGTVGKMCALTDRKFIGIEISEEYCEIAAKRIDKTLSQPKLFPWEDG